MAHLKTRIANLLTQRNKLQAYYSATTESAPEKIETLEDKFIANIHETINKNIENTGFDVDELSGALSMSRSQLFRKYKAITGSSPSDLIRSLRLNRALEIMKENNVSIKEVAYQSGFSGPSYFITCFKKQFGKTPTEYLELDKKEK
jgi:AraC-like DNA-binding protein